MSDGYHFKLALSHELWNELLRAALPVSLADGEFDLARNTRDAIRRLGVRDRVAGLLEDRNPPKVLVRAKDRAVQVWRNRRDSAYRRLSQLIRVEGTWRVELSDMGTEFTYGQQKVGADAYVSGIAEGRVLLLRENIEFPFTIEKRLGASVAVGDIHYDTSREAVIGSLQDLGIHLGEGAILQLLSRLGEFALEQQLPKANPVPILKRAQVEDLVKPIGGPLKADLGVEDLRLDIDGDDMQLKVRFGFSKAQLVDTQRPPN
jgi:hypothetical protein